LKQKKEIENTTKVKQTYVCLEKRIQNDQFPLEDEKKTLSQYKF
jgi:hypothetical protein